MRVQLKHDAGIEGAAVSMEFSFSYRASTAYPRLFTSFSPKVKRDIILVTKKLNLLIARAFQLCLDIPK